MVEGSGLCGVGDGLLLDVCSDLSPSSVLRTASHPLIPPSSVVTQIHSRFCSSSCFYDSSRFYSRASAGTLPVIDPGFSCSALQIRVASWPSREGPAIQDDPRSSPLSWFSLLFLVDSSMLLWGQCSARQTSTACHSSCGLPCLRPSFYIRGTSFLPERKGKCLWLSCVWLCESMTVAWQAPRSMEFSRQEYWSGLHTPEEPPDPGIEPQSRLALQAGKFSGKPFLPDHALKKQSPFVSALCLGVVIPWAGCPVQGLSYDSSQEASGSFGKMVSCSSPWTSQDSIDTYACKWDSLPWPLRLHTVGGFPSQ